MNITLEINNGKEKKTLYVDDNGGYSFEGKLDIDGDILLKYIGGLIHELETEKLYRS